MATNSSKRTAERPNDSKNYKRSKLRRARDILAQTPDKSISTNTLDVPKFVKAREFEIEQLEKAILNSKMTGAKRAFQSVPRSLRRRTASHNVKRVPSRLRDRAKKEMETDNTPTLSKLKKDKKLRGHDRVVKDCESKSLRRESSGQPLVPQDHVGKSNELAQSPNIKLKFAKRQKNKVWLPTHVWHAKRAHMVTKWGYSIPQRPSEKSYRATHRAHTVSGAIAWDTSYIGTFILKGQYEHIASVLEKFVPSLAWSPVVSSGTRCWEGMWSSTPSRFLGPCLIYWNPPNLAQSGKDVIRQVMVRFHPAIYETAFRMVVHEAETTSNSNVICEDLRYAIGSIELLGSKSLSSLQSILHPDKSLSSFKNWVSLSGVANSTSLPNCMALTMKVADPRLFKNKAKDRPNRSSSETIIDLISQWPSASMASDCQIFSASARQTSYDTQLSLKELDRGKGAELRGEKNPYASQYTNYSIPIILLKREDGESWSLFLPWGWVLPFWHCLMHIPHIRIGGIDQHHQLAFERGFAYFPTDYPNTLAGKENNRENSLALQNEWNRKPAAKRLSYHAVRTADFAQGEHGDPFCCDWNYLGNIYKDLDSMAQVSIKYLHRGSPLDRARIYKIDEETKAEWKSLLTTKDIDMSNYPVSPDHFHLIGFVTTGAFNLSEGSGFGIGSIVLCAIEPQTDSENLCLVRNVGTNISRLARWSIIS